MSNKLLLMAIASIAISACTKNEVKVYSDAEPISFQPVFAKQQTKAGTAPETTFTFKSCAFLNTENTNPYIPVGVVSYDATSTKYKMTTSYYWPKTGSLTFYSWSPTSVNHTSVSGAGVVFENFSDTDKDLLYAKNSELTSGTVAAAFNHILTKIVVNASAPNGTVTLKKIVIKNLRPKGTFESETWTAGGTAADKEITEGETELSSTAAQVADLMIIPQTATSFEITYTTTSNGVESETTTATVTVSSDAWEMGKKLTYNLTITLNEILWEPTVVDWEPVDGTALEI